MSKQVRRLLAAAVAILVIIGFGILYGYAFWRTWAGQYNPAPQYIYVATALSGLVAGIVAMIFDQKLPDQPPKPGKNRSASIGNSKASGWRAGLSALRGSVTIVPNPDLLEIVSVAYVLLYFTAGIAAIATWIISKDNTPDLVKNLALISLGLFVAIARSFFDVSN
jgi:hypothetical protein